MIQTARDVMLAILGAAFLFIGYYDCVNGCWIFGGWQDFTLGLSLFIVAVTPLTQSILSACFRRLTR